MTSAVDIPVTTATPTSAGPFIWRAIIPVADRHARRLTRDPHALHRLVLAAYPVEAGARADHDVLWRGDMRGSTLDLAIQATIPPDLDRFTVDRDWRGDWPVSDPHDLAATLHRFTTGQLVRFRLRANAAKASFAERDTRNGRDRGKRLSLLDPADRLAWLTRRLAGALTLATDPGTDQTAVVMTDRGPTTVSKPGGHRVTLCTVDYEGAATIDDPATLAALVTTGIGRGRAYGLGLLQVLPLR